MSLEVGHAVSFSRTFPADSRRLFFRKRATNYRALLRKMTYEDKASYDCTPPCIILADYSRGFAHGGDQTSYVRISRLPSFPRFSLE